MNWYCVYKSQEEGYILTEIAQQRVLAGTEFWTCDLLTQIFFNLQPYLPYRIWPFSWLHTVGPHSNGQYSGGPLCSSRQQAVRNTVHTFPGPVCLERVWPPICFAYMLPQRSPDCKKESLLGLLRIGQVGSPTNGVSKEWDGLGIFKKKDCNKTLRAEGKSCLRPEPGHVTADKKSPIYRFLGEADCFGEGSTRSSKTFWKLRFIQFRKLFCS